MARKSRKESVRTVAASALTAGMGVYRIAVYVSCQRKCDKEVDTEIPWMEPSVHPADCAVWGAFHLVFIKRKDQGG